MRERVQVEERPEPRRHHVRRIGDGRGDQRDHQHEPEEVLQIAKHHVDQREHPRESRDRHEEQGPQDGHEHDRPRRVTGDHVREDDQHDSDDHASLAQQHRFRDDQIEREDDARQDELVGHDRAHALRQGFRHHQEWREPGEDVQHVLSGREPRDLHAKDHLVDGGIDREQHQRIHEEPSCSEQRPGISGPQLVPGHPQEDSGMRPHAARRMPRRDPAFHRR